MPNSTKAPEDMLRKRAERLLNRMEDHARAAKAAEDAGDLDLRSHELSKLLKATTKCRKIMEQLAFFG
jgi:hypothetical protein